MTKRVVTALAVLLAAGFSLADWLSVGGTSGSARISVVEQSSNGTTFEVMVPGVEVTETSIEGYQFSLVTLPGEVFANLEQGKPQVPKVSVLLAIPSGARVTTRVLSRETKTLKVANVYPLQPPLLDNQEPGPLSFNQAFYAQSVTYPGRAVSLIETGVWRDLAVANLQVYPVQVNPGKGEIEVTQRIRVRVDYSGGSYPATVTDWMVPAYSRYIDNFRHLPVSVQDEYSAGVRFLVIGHSDYATHSYLNDSLLNWVKQRGYDTRAIYKSSWTAQEVKDSINAEYTRNNPKTLRWVLLVGEYAQIPMRAQGGVGHGDYWYKDLEPWSAGDNYPEIGLARYSPTSSTDLDNQIRKALKYEKNPPSTSNWLDKYMLPAHSEQYPGKYSGCVRGIYQMPKPFWAPSVVETVMGYYTGNTTVTNNINAGRGIVNYRGHGDTQEWWSWGTEGSWYNSHVDALANGDLTPVVYNIACSCGDIAVSECLSEKWLRKYPGGAVASLAATQASYTYPNHGICSTLVRSTCDTWTITVPGVRNYTMPQTNLAGIHMNLDAYVAKYWPGSPYPDNIYMYNMLGNPAMAVWSGGMPASASISAPDSVPTGPYNMNVTVTTGGQPVEGALVCAYKVPDVYVAERTDASGTATLALNAGTPGSMLVTVSEGHARSSVPGVPHTPILPGTRNVMVGGGGNPQPNIIYVSNQVIDSTGNNNGRFDPGETGKIYVTIRNNGNAAAQNVTARLSSNNAQFVVSDPNSNYGTIPQDSSRNNRADPFVADAGSGIPGGTTVTCTLKVHSDNFAHDWTFTFGLQVGVPPIPGQLVFDLDTGAVALSVCGIGSIGYDEPPAFDLGSGFRVPKTASSCLFYGSLEAGNSANYLVDHFFSQPANSGTNHDWRMTDSFRIVLPPYPADEHWRNTMSDAGHPSPKGLNVEANWYMLANPNYDDFAIVTYDFTNQGSQSIDGLYVGYHCDFDIGSDPTTNVAATDTVRRRVWMKQQSSENPTAGLVILEPANFRNLAAIDHAVWVYPDSCVTDNQKYRILNGAIGLRSSNRAYDWSIAASAGPFNLPVGGTQRVSFAVVGATTMSGFSAAAESAQNWYNANLLGISEPEVVNAATAERPLFLSPNPFRGGTFVHYFSRAEGPLVLTAYDATGRAVAEQSFAVRAGAGRLFWQPKLLSRGIYFLRVSMPNHESVSKFLLLD